MRNTTPKEWKAVALRDCLPPERINQCTNPRHAARYWKLNIETDAGFNPQCENLVVLLLNTRRRIIGHSTVSIGTVGSVNIHARETFRLACITAADAVVIMHNHPSGESAPSDEDIMVTRRMAEAVRRIGIKLEDHVIMGHKRHTSLKQLGYIK